MTCAYCKNITVCAICGKGYAEAARASDAQPTQLDSMNALRVQAERKAALYRRALLLACNGDDNQVAFFVSEASTAIAEDRAASGVADTYRPKPDGSCCGLTVAHRCAGCPHGVMASDGSKAE